MSVLHLFRRRRYASSMLAVFALAWLQMAVAPCLMASEIAESHLAANGVAAHSGHLDSVPLPTAAEGTAAHCKYCPSENSGSPCPEANTDCAFVHDPGVDARSAATTQLEKLSTHAALLDGSAFGLLRVLREPASQAAAEAAKPPARRPVILENCVQLR